MGYPTLHSKKAWPSERGLLDGAGTGYIPAGGADDAGSGPWQAVLSGGAGSRWRVRLADVIADDLVVLFCGANPGLSSAAARAPFATSDRWWPALYQSGFTPRRLAPHEAHELLALGLGLTSLVRRPTVGVAELSRAEFVEGARLLRRRVLARRPRWLAVLGVTAYRAAFGRPDAAVGLQEDTIGSDQALDTAQSERPQRALSSPGARHRVRPAAGGRGSPRSVEAARKRGPRRRGCPMADSRITGTISGVDPG